MSRSDHRVVVEVVELRVVHLRSRDLGDLGVRSMGSVSHVTSRDFGDLGVWGSRRSTDRRDMSVHLSRHEDDSRVVLSSLRKSS